MWPIACARGYRDLFPLISSKIERLESEDFKQDFKAKKAKRILDGLMRKFGFDYDNAADVLDQVCETYCEEFERRLNPLKSIRGRSF